MGRCSGYTRDEQLEQPVDSRSGHLPHIPPPFWRFHTRSIIARCTDRAPPTTTRTTTRTPADRSSVGYRLLHTAAPDHPQRPASPVTHRRLLALGGRAGRRVHPPGRTPQTGHLTPTSSLWSMRSCPLPVQLRRRCHIPGAAVRQGYGTPSTGTWRGTTMAPYVHPMEIARPPDQVYAYATDPTRFPEWQGDVVSVRVDGGDPLRVGSRVTTVRRIGRAERAMVQERSRRSTDLDAGRRAGWPDRSARAPASPGSRSTGRPVAGYLHPRLRGPRDRRATRSRDPGDGRQGSADQLP